MFGAEFDITPATYIFPDDYIRFKHEKAAEPNGIWIAKPAASSCGRGIRVYSSKHKIPKRSGYIISKYISNPHTIDGYKYDLRLYVCVTSFDPLRVYLYKEGLVRFATS